MNLSTNSFFRFDPRDELPPSTELPLEPIQYRSPFKVCSCQLTTNGRLAEPAEPLDMVTVAPGEKLDLRSSSLFPAAATPETA
jgi:hypothetical protein